MNLTGTLRQAELILTLRERAGMPVVDRDTAIQRVVTSPQAKVQELIDKLNADLGYNPDSATERQRKFGRDLERKLGVDASERANWDSLTTQQASARIQKLRAELDNTR